MSIEGEKDTQLEVFRFNHHFYKNNPPKHPLNAFNPSRGTKPCLSGEPHTPLDGRVPHRVIKYSVLGNKIELFDGFLHTAFNYPLLHTEKTREGFVKLVT